ncbi:hypothetical protein GSI_13246 [Ganoderma sinense ZZ0214-1]|uniref:Apple domain-containing protein n=1 Tax=Ganoderma sinense ZZ0214-1 TaxID=1077348 RepID=A0A2G8RV10_9APHY|nr:hypothetical protein GSI_13246 [Ganoderma sinense ZZ0214-1]
MFTALIALVLAAVSQIAHTTPTTSDVSIAAIHGLSESAAADPPTLVFCAEANCTLSSCAGFDLTTFPLNTCIAANMTALSVGVASNETLSFTVDIGTDNCTSLVPIPTFNDCYNVVRGGPYTSFELIGSQ